jgi:CRISPR-associated protein Cas6
MKVDVQFRVLGTEVPADHGYLLLSTLARIVPDLHGDDAVGVHPIGGRLIGNRRLALTDRSRLTIRIETERIAQVLPLAGKSLVIDGSPIRVGTPQTQALIPAPRLYSRLVVIKGFLEPEPFLDAARRQLEALAIHGEAQLVPQPAVAAANQGRPSGSRSPFLRRTIRIHDRDVVGFALRVQDLTAEESIALQEHGLGGRRRFGCGILIRDWREGGTP